MKLLTCTFQRPNGSVYTKGRRLAENVSPEIAEAAAFGAIRPASADDRLIARKIADSTAVRVASKRNTSVSDNLLSETPDDGRDMKAGVQHADAVGGEAVVGDGTGEALPEIDASAPQAEAEGSMSLDEIDTHEEVVEMQTEGEGVHDAGEAAEAMQAEGALDDVGSEPDGPAGRKPRKKTT
jgi:hypothetical protein